VGGDDQLAGEEEEDVQLDGDAEALPLEDLVEVEDREEDVRCIGDGAFHFATCSPLKWSLCCLEDVRRVGIHLADGTTALLFRDFGHGTCSILVIIANKKPHKANVISKRRCTRTCRQAPSTPDWLAAQASHASKGVSQTSMHEEASSKQDEGI